MTPRGKGLAGMSILMLVFGSLIGEQVVVQVGIFGLLLLVLCHRLSIINLGKIHFLRRLPRAVFSGVNFDYQIEIINYRRWFGGKNIIDFSIIRRAWDFFWSVNLFDYTKFF